jgi:hypothetical protein
MDGCPILGEGVGWASHAGEAPPSAVYKIYNGYWLFGRPPEDLRQDLRALTKKWDITTPELKEAWSGGRKELFYPYGKTYAQTLGEQD